MSEDLVIAAPQRAQLHELSGGGPILVLAPHPDDESLGCGALLAEAFRGPGAHIVCMTDGGASHPASVTWPRHRLAALRAAELDAAIAALGGDPTDVTRLNLPDAGMLEFQDQYAEIAARIGVLARRMGARSLFGPSCRDPHCDHVATDRIAVFTARMAGLRHLTYPIWSRWREGDRTNGIVYRFDTAPHRVRKASAIACHRSQLGEVEGLDPDGFTMEPNFVALFRDGDELFAEAAV